MKSAMYTGFMEGIPNRTEQHKKALEAHDAAYAAHILEDLGITEAELLGKKALDLGAGSGEFARWAKQKGADVTPIDLSFSKKDVHRFEAVEVTPVVGNVTSLPFADESFDLVLSNAAIPNVIDAGTSHKLEDDYFALDEMHKRRQEVFREALRVLRPGGEIRFAPVIRNERGESAWPGRSESVEAVLEELKSEPTIEVQEKLLEKDEQHGEEGLSDSWRIVIRKKHPMEVSDHGKENALDDPEQIPQPISFKFENSGEISPEHEAQAKAAFALAADSLKNEWHIESPLPINVAIMSDEAFREGATEGPMSWKYCFLLRDQPDNKVYCNVDIFDVLPDEADAIIKHETAHIVVGQLVGDHTKYAKSFFLEEGTAGLDSATEKLIAKLKDEKITNIPDPMQLQTIEATKAIGGDTNIEPFTDQLGYLVLFSTVEFLRKRHGEQKIVEVYKALDEDVSLEEAYQQVCGEQLQDAVAEWQASLQI
jgi:ubiquinone/menaquinone biosynthesis C-methylase UbiE